MIGETEAPGWLLEPQPPPSQASDPLTGVRKALFRRTGMQDHDSLNQRRGRNRRRRVDFIAKTLDGLTRVVLEDVLAGTVASRPGLLQALDPRTKVLTAILLIGATGLVHHPVTLLVLHLWTLCLVRVSSIALSHFLRRVWPAVLLFSGIMIFPSLFNFVRPGSTLLVLHDFGHPVHLGPWVFPEVLAVTSQGVRGATIFLLRVGTCVSLALLLTLTTRWGELLRALQALRVPPVFITMVAMAYRYVYLLLPLTGDVFAARKSRTVGRISTREQRRFVAGAIGALWNRAYALSEEMHEAMVSRGYNGRMRAPAGHRISRLDQLWCVFVILVCMVCLRGDRFLG